jgi:hypothetical protein
VHVHVVAQGASAIYAHTHVIALMKNLLILQRASPASWRGCKLGLHMLLSHENVSSEIARRALLPPPPPPVTPLAYSVEEGKEVIDEVVAALVEHLAPEKMQMQASPAVSGVRVGEGEEDEEEDVDVDDCVGALSGLTQCRRIVEHLDTHPCLPVLVLRLVMVLASSEGDHADASSAISKLLLFSASARDALQRTLRYLTDMMLGRVTTESVSSASSRGNVPRGDGDRMNDGDWAGVCRGEILRFGVAALEQDLHAWPDLCGVNARASSFTIAGLLLRAVPDVAYHLPHSLIPPLPTTSITPGHFRADDGSLSQGPSAWCVGSVVLDMLTAAGGIGEGGKRSQWVAVAGEASFLLRVLLECQGRGDVARRVREMCEETERLPRLLARVLFLVHSSGAYVQSCPRVCMSV